MHIWKNLKIPCGHDLSKFISKAQFSKIGKKCNFKSTKTHFFAISKMAKKTIFAPEKSLKLYFW